MLARLHKCQLRKATSSHDNASPSRHVYIRVQHLVVPRRKEDVILLRLCGLRLLRQRLAYRVEPVLLLHVTGKPNMLSATVPPFRSPIPSNSHNYNTDKQSIIPLTMQRNIRTRKTVHTKNTPPFAIALHGPPPAPPLPVPPASPPPLLLRPSLRPSLLLPPSPLHNNEKTRQSGTTARIFNPSRTSQSGQTAQRTGNT